MELDVGSRWVIIGNSGSGKSNLAMRIGAHLNIPVHDLDLIHWHTDGCKRAEAESKVLVAEIAAANDWVIEGVYGWLAEVALARATALVWLDLPWHKCREGLYARGPRRGQPLSDQDPLLMWAENYWTRTTSSSFKGHERLFDGFANPKARLKTRDASSALLPGALSRSFTCCDASAI
jgi:adenylate kinase family enzyme